MKLVVAGSRSITSKKLVVDALVACPWWPAVDEIVSGGARGVDTLAEEIAKGLGYKFTLFPAEWDEYGKSAGHIRNQQMAEYGDFLATVWDGKSKGTQSMIQRMVRQNKPVYIHPGG